MAISLSGKPGLKVAQIADFQAHLGFEAGYRKKI